MLAGVDQNSCGSLPPFKIPFGLLGWGTSGSEENNKLRVFEGHGVSSGLYKAGYVLDVGAKPQSAPISAAPALTAASPTEHSQSCYGGAGKFYTGRRLALQNTFLTFHPAKCKQGLRASQVEPVLQELTPAQTPARCVI